MRCFLRANACCACCVVQNSFATRRSTAADDMRPTSTCKRLMRSSLWVRPFHLHARHITSFRTFVFAVFINNVLGLHFCTAVPSAVVNRPCATLFGIHQRFADRQVVLLRCARLAWWRAPSRRAGVAWNKRLRRVGARRIA